MGNVDFLMMQFGTVCTKGLVFIYVEMHDASLWKFVVTSWWSIYGILKNGLKISKYKVDLLKTEFTLKRIQIWPLYF